MPHGSCKSALKSQSLKDFKFQFLVFFFYRMHYNVMLKSIEVNGHSLQIGAHLNGTSQLSGTIFDSGTTLAYVPQSIYQEFLEEVLQ